jgi:hypothetical protein
LSRDRASRKTRCCWFWHHLRECIQDRTDIHSQTSSDFILPKQWNLKNSVAMDRLFVNSMRRIIRKFLDLGVDEGLEISAYSSYAAYKSQNFPVLVIVGTK